MAAPLPRGFAAESFQSLLLVFLPGTIYLVFRGVETAAVKFGFSGLAQGCPLSCFLYLLVIDPLLHKIRKHPGVLQLSAFADDWTIACQGLLPLFSLRPIIRAFEIASGQEINEPKSGIIPSRELSRAEQLCCLVHWRNIQILYRTRILGLIIGLQATIEDPFDQDDWVNWSKVDPLQQPC